MSVPPKVVPLILVAKCLGGEGTSQGISVRHLSRRPSTTRGQVNTHMNTSPVAVKGVAVDTVSNGGSIVKPIVFCPLRPSTNTDLVGSVSSFGGEGEFCLQPIQFLCSLPGDSDLSQGLQAIFVVVNSHGS